MQDPTNNLRDARPDWGTRCILAALDTARVWGEGEGRLTEAERGLLFTIEYRLRHRLGQADPDGIGFDELAEFMLERSVAEIRAEQKAAAR